MHDYVTPHVTEAFTELEFTAETSLATGIKQETNLQAQVETQTHCLCIIQQ